MTVRRLLFCIIAAVAISIVSIYHHAQAVSHGYSLGRLQAQNARMRVANAGLEARVTMLASPARLRGENSRMQLGLVGPSNWQEGQPAMSLASLEESQTGTRAR